MVLAPRKSLLPIEMEALAVYLKQGGRALFAAEPKTTTDIAELVKPYGISIGNDLVVDQVVGLFAGPSLGVQPMGSSFAKHPATLGFDKNIAFSTASSVQQGWSHYYQELPLRSLPFQDEIVGRRAT